MANPSSQAKSFSGLTRSGWQRQMISSDRRRYGEGVRMTERDAGYLEALSDVQSEVRRSVQDPSTSSEGKLELLGVLSFLSDLVGTKMLRHGGGGAVGTAGVNDGELKE
jgi:hypothetical protein